MPLVVIIIVVISAIAGLLFFISPDRQSPTEQPEPERKANADLMQEMEGETQFPEPLPKPLTTETPPEASTTSSEQSAYTDGTYTANASYFTPKRVQHNISVTLTINDDVITAADVLYDGAEARTPSHTNFDGAYEQIVLGVEIDDLDLARVGGASLTTTAFNETLADIATEASTQ